MEVEPQLTLYGIVPVARSAHDQHPDIGTTRKTSIREAGPPSYHQDVLYDCASTERY